MGKVGVLVKEMVSILYVQNNLWLLVAASGKNMQGWDGFPLELFFNVCEKKTGWTFHFCVNIDCLPPISKLERGNEERVDVRD